MIIFVDQLSDNIKIKDGKLTVYPEKKKPIKFSSEKLNYVELPLVNVKSDRLSGSKLIHLVSVDYNLAKKGIFCLSWEIADNKIFAILRAYDDIEINHKTPIFNISVLDPSAKCSFKVLNSKEEKADEQKDGISILY